eukprot:Gb_30407 [translate_table: standard]
MTPLMHLSEKLASKGLVITFVITEYIHSRMVKARADGTNIFDPAFDIHVAQISDGLSLDFDRLANSLEYYHAVNNMGSAFEGLLMSINKLNKADPVSSIIASSFLPWTFDVANKFHLPWIFFWSQSATCFVLYNHLQEIISNVHFPPKKTDKGDTTIDYIPGLPLMQPRDLPFQVKDNDLASFMHQLISCQFQLLDKADWVIGNTVYDLESEANDAVQVKTAPIHSMGPLIPLAYLLRGLNSEQVIIKPKTSLWTESNCLPWLDLKPTSSVLYISFGSMNQVSQTQVLEIAMGLLESQQFFLWVVRPDIVSSDGADALPQGFLENTRDQGVVVPWCSQVSVLSHPPIGGFFTHGGWNSTMESLSLGVQILVFPQ